MGISIIGASRPLSGLDIVGTDPKSLPSYEQDSPSSDRHSNAHGAKGSSPAHATPSNQTRSASCCRRPQHPHLSSSPQATHSRAHMLRARSCETLARQSIVNAHNADGTAGTGCDTTTYCNSSGTSCTDCGCECRLAQEAPVGKSA